MSLKSIKDEIKKLDLLIEKDPDNEDLYLKRGNLKFKIQDCAGAFNDFTEVLKINPENISAKTKLDYIQLNFKHRNEDIYANTNLYKDPWLE
ncbi:MAG: hypothetical protein J7J86_01760 [Bacteroidales bacterium]|nr:hypothetical protein [Bacteroidales bacterium]